MRSFNGGTPSAFTSLRFKDCSSKVIFGKILLIPVFHHRRLAEMFGKILLSLSSLLLIKTQNYYKKKPDNSQEVPGLFCRFSFYLYIEKNNTNRCCLSFHLYFLYLQNCIQRIILFSHCACLFCGISGEEGALTGRRQNTGLLWRQN